MNTETGQSVPQDMSTEGVPEVEQEPRQDWFFTFGAGLPHDGRYVVIHGTEVAARAEMVAHFGNRWCDQYRTAERAGIDEYDLIALPRAFWPEPTAAAPTSFEERVAVHVRRLDAERTPVAAVEEHTGVSDVQAEVLDEVTALRLDLAPVREMTWTERHNGLGPTLMQAIDARLDRIEQWVRGEQR